MGGLGNPDAKPEGLGLHTPLGLPSAALHTPLQLRGACDFQFHEGILTGKYTLSHCQAAVGWLASQPPLPPLGTPASHHPHCDPESFLCGQPVV